MPVRTNATANVGESTIGFLTALTSDTTTLRLSCVCEVLSRISKVMVIPRWRRTRSRRRLRPDDPRLIGQRSAAAPRDFSGSGVSSPVREILAWRVIPTANDRAASDWRRAMMAALLKERLRRAS